MKIGVLTFCNANNYGAVLQAYSLQKKLEEIGLESELVDYRCPAIEAMHAPLPLSAQKSLKANVYSILFNLLFARRRMAFRRFRKLMKTSRPYDPADICHANAEYGAFIVGSDQVFNLKLTKGDKAFFLDFAEEGKKKIAFAASVGEYLEEEKENYKKLLSRFDYLSVREESSASLLKNQLGVDCQVIPDPVFLHSGKEWEKLLGLKLKKHGYVLVYSLHNMPELYQYANKLAQEKGIKVISVTKYLRPAGKVDMVNRHASPKDFIELILNADYFVTDSFHGTAFSLIFEKQFMTLLPSAAPERIIDLLREVGLPERAVHTSDKIRSDAIDFAPVREKIDELRARGVRYLNDVICK